MRFFFVLGFIASLALPASLASAMPACPTDAAIVSTNQFQISSQSFSTAAVCVQSGVSVAEDISTYGPSQMYIENAFVGVDVDAYSDATVHISGTSVGASIDAYTRSTINVYSGVSAETALAYSGGTLNLFGGAFTDVLGVFGGGTVNLHAATLSSHGFGNVSDLSGTVVGTYLDGSAFSIDFSNSSGLGSFNLFYVPEPSTALFLGLGLAALSRRSRRASRASSSRGPGPTA